MNELITIERGIAVLDAETEQQLVMLNRSINTLKEQEEAIRQAIFDAMEATGTITIDTDLVHINYIAETDREIFDSKKLKKDNPDLYDEYVSIGKVKASVRVKVKE